jgi:hypothetical protein
VAEVLRRAEHGLYSDALADLDRARDDALKVHHSEVVREQGQTDNPRDLPGDGVRIEALAEGAVARSSRLPRTVDASDDPELRLSGHALRGWQSNQLAITRDNDVTSRLMVLGNGALYGGRERVACSQGEPKLWILRRG